MFVSLYDTASIQPYIFGSNKLKENLGASQLVHVALDDWLSDAASKCGATRDWSGGGNAVVVSNDEGTARRVATALSRRLHEEAPGLSVVCAHEPWDGAEATFRDAFAGAQRQVAERKDGRWSEVVFDGAGVTAWCRSTGAPAVERDSEGSWVGAEAAGKLAAEAEARARLEALHPLPKGYRYTATFDELGRTRGERSMVGVLHFDGNGIGKRFRQAARGTSARASLQDLSARVNQVGTAALVDVLQWITRNLETLGGAGPREFQLLIGGDGQKCFPVRPIVYGGDDVTLVCDARIALDLAEALLRAWHRRSEETFQTQAHACVGVALVHSHFPFFRAYELAEELCRRCKVALKDCEASALDWQFSAGGAVTTVDAQRKTDLAFDGKVLHARPKVVVGAVPAGLTPFHQWPWFREVLLATLQGDEWSEFRTQLKGFSETLREGSDASKRALERWSKAGRQLPGIATLPALNTTAFHAGMTPYLDALELLDHTVERSFWRSSLHPAPTQKVLP